MWRCVTGFFTDMSHEHESVTGCTRKSRFILWSTTLGRNWHSKHQEWPILAKVTSLEMLDVEALFQLMRVLGSSLLRSAVEHLRHKLVGLYVVPEQENHSAALHMLH